VPDHFDGLERHFGQVNAGIGYWVDAMAFHPAYYNWGMQFGLFLKVQKQPDGSTWSPLSNDAPAG
jgi:hypothetical protein